MYPTYGLIIGTLLIVAHQAVAMGFNMSIALQERCAICTNYLGSKNVDLKGIEAYDGFDGFLAKYQEYEEFGIDNPEVICMLTDMCPLYSELVINLNFIEGGNYDTELLSQEMAGKQLFSLNPVCFVCKKLVSWVIKQLERLNNKRRNKGVVRGFISKGCKHLIKPLRNPCHNFITKKSGPIVKALIRHLGPRLACMAARVC